MCGPTDSEKSLQASETNLSNTLQSNFNTRFANQSQVLNQLNNTLTPTIAAGPGQAGWSAPEAAAINTNILDTTAANYQNAARAVNSQIAGRGAGGPGVGAGGSSGLASGVDQQIRESVATQAAQQTSQEENSATLANYQQGNANYNKAIGGAQALAEAYNPTQYASLSTTANNSAFGQADTIQEQQNQEDMEIAGLVTGGASALAGGIGGALGGGGLKGFMNGVGT